MKKLTALLLAVVMMVSLTACGGGGGTTKNKDNGTDKQQTQTDNQTDDNKPADDNKPDTEVTDGEYIEKDGFMQLNGKLPNSTTDMVVTQLKTDKATYEAGEEVIVTIKWTGTPAEDAWLGFFTADVPHGDEEVNDGRYFNWTRLSHVEDNKVALNAASGDEQSEYTIRVFENDNGGAEVAWCTVTVK